MPRVAILIAASPTPAFYSQVAALSLCLRKLRWSRWQPSVHMYVGGEHEAGTRARWRPHLGDVEISWVSDSRFARDGDWAQSDDVFRFAPRDADVLVAMDADTLPVTDLEDLLDRVHDTSSIAGVIAHYPLPSLSKVSPRDMWLHLARDVIDVPLEFAFTHTLMSPDLPAGERVTPFYLNFGVVAFPRVTFDDVTARYLSIRPRLVGRMAFPDFSGQAALTLAIAAAGARTLALPMRFNFPNDPVAEEMYPDELANVVIFHYLRTTNFDRHELFVSAERYRAFLDLPLAGVDRAFQETVRATFGSDYPFAPPPAPIARHT